MEELDMPISGIKIPEMGINLTQAVSLSDALFTTTQQRLLALLFGQSHRSFFANELIRLTGSGSGAVQRELKRLTDSGLLISKRIGNQHHFQANQAAPIFQEVVAIVQKTFGVAEPIRKALMPYEEAIHCAFIFGSVAKRRDTAESDIDLFVVTDTLTSGDLINQLLQVEVQLVRTINTKIYSKAELTKALQEKNSFVTRVLEQPKIWVMGDESDL
jgi:predicted nucleotidyltransferase